MLKRKGEDTSPPNVIVGFALVLGVGVVLLLIFKGPSIAIAITAKNITNQTVQGLKDIFGGNEKTLKEIEDESGYGTATLIKLNNEPNKVAVIGGKEYYVRLTQEGDTAVIANISTARDSGFVNCNAGLPWKLYPAENDCCLNSSIDLCLKFAGYIENEGEINDAQILVSSKEEVPLPVSQTLYLKPENGARNLIFWAQGQRFIVTLDDLNQLINQEAQFTIELYLPDGSKQLMCNDVWVKEGDFLTNCGYFTLSGKLKVDTIRIVAEPKYARISILPQKPQTIGPN